MNLLNPRTFFQLKKINKDNNIKTGVTIAVSFAKSANRNNTPVANAHPNLTEFCFEATASFIKQYHAPNMKNMHRISCRLSIYVTEIVWIGWAINKREARSAKWLLLNKAASIKKISMPHPACHNMLVRWYPAGLSFHIR